jgi:hypothetical protein
VLRRAILQDLGACSQGFKSLRQRTNTPRRSQSHEGHLSAEVLQHSHACLAATNQHKMIQYSRYCRAHGYSREDDCAIPFWINVRHCHKTMFGPQNRHVYVLDDVMVNQKKSMDELNRCEKKNETAASVCSISNRTKHEILLMSLKMAKITHEPDLFSLHFF